MHSLSANAADVKSAPSSHARWRAARPQRTPRAPLNPHRESYLALERRCRLGERQREQRARVNIDRAQWKLAYRAMRCLRGRAINWLYRSARIPSDLAVDYYTLSTRLLVVSRDEHVTYENPLCVVFRWGAKDDAWTDLWTYTLAIAPETPRPIPSGTIRWALGALAMYIARQGSSGTWERHGKWAQVIPQWEWRVERLIADELYRIADAWPEKHAARLRNERLRELRHRLEKQDIRWRRRAVKRAKAGAR